MGYKEVQDKIKQIDTENIIWIIYIGIIFFSLYSNTLERKYFIYNDVKSKNTYRNITIGIFTILVIVYFYFLKDSFNDVKSLNANDTYKKRYLTKLSFFGSLLIFISGIIFLYIAYSDENIDVEVAFN